MYHTRDGSCASQLETSSLAWVLFGPLGLTQLLNHPLFDSFGSWVHYPKDIPINFTFANFCLVHNNGNVIGI